MNPLDASRYVRHLRRLADLRDGRKERAVAFKSKRTYSRKGKSLRVEGD